jgi:ABC-type sugar transport system substrate-binding protein
LKNIIGAFCTLLILVLNLLLCMEVSISCAAVSAAKEYKADVIAEIENSNFNPYVINACKQQAQDAGYELQVTEVVYDEERDLRTAEIILSYHYEMPVFGISQTKSTRGIAR